MTDDMAKAGRIRVGIGGWTYAPWRGTFYPEGLPQKRELEYASRQVTAIEINGTFYRMQSAASFARWRDETPDDFVFAVKAPRYATHRSVLAEAAASIERFLAGGVLALGPKLGPILWQLPPAKRFDPDDFRRFLELVTSGPRLRHAIEARHPSFACAECAALARSHGVAVVFADVVDAPLQADVTADFVYARLKRSQPRLATGYPEHALDEWAGRVQSWARGQQRSVVSPVHGETARSTPRDVFVFMIDGAKERAPAAAKALLARLQPAGRRA